MFETIFINDENKIEAIDAILEKVGYKVIKTSNENEILCIIKKLIPDLFILNIKKIKDTDLNICKKIRSIKKFNNVPVVILSNKLKTIEKKIFFEAGADGFITKPFGVNGFIDSVATYLEFREECV